MSDTYTEYTVKGPGGVPAIFGIRREYETIFVDGTLEISAIYNKSRRKQKVLWDMKNVLGWRIGTREETARLGKADRDYSSGQKDALCCAMKVSLEKSAIVVLFEPGEELAQIIRTRYRAQEA